MEAYFWVFVNFKQNDLARLLLLAKFANNIAKDASTGYIPFELNCRYYPRVSYKETVIHAQSQKP